MAATKKRRKRYNNNRAGKMCISLILVAFVAVMSIQIVKLYQKDQEYIQQEEALREELEAETERQAELEEYQAYTGTPEYVEDVAHSNLGLVYDNEIVYKEEE